MTEEGKEVLPQIAEDPVWATLGENPFEWKNEEFRNAYIAGCKCSYAGKMAGDMNENELRVFVGALDNLCAQMHGAMIMGQATATDTEQDPEVLAEIARLKVDEEAESVPA